MHFGALARAAAAIDRELLLSFDERKTYLAKAKIPLNNCFSRFVVRLSSVKTQ